MKARNNKFGIMGGSFDPIHFGHLQVAEFARERMDLNMVFFVISHCPPHKSINDLSSSHHRLSMVELAIRDRPYFESSKIDIESGCPTYTGDTIRRFKKNYGDDKEIYFISGIDVILAIINWDKARTYPGICNFIAATRPGYDEIEIGNKIPDIFKPFITIIEVPLLAISSTEIRLRIKSDKSIAGMAPDPVQNYINKNDLYKGKGV
ncbi:MAG: nicotinate-nucleotide adenylyltransferase [Spirochaetota bacterium]|nr:nicotinate-nucleotide adenylyltransferase [Spirochaetota bacterium]